MSTIYMFCMMLDVKIEGYITTADAETIEIKLLLSFVCQLYLKILFRMKFIIRN